MDNKVRTALSVKFAGTDTVQALAAFVYTSIDYADKSEPPGPWALQAPSFRAGLSRIISDQIVTLVDDETSYVRDVKEWHSEWSTRMLSLVLDNLQSDASVMETLEKQGEAALGDWDNLNPTMQSMYALCWKAAEAFVQQRFTAMR